MKNILRFICLFMAMGFFSSAIAQKYQFPENGSKRGFHLKSSAKGNLLLDYQLRDFELIDVHADGTDMKQLQYGSIQIPGEAGSPDLPFEGQYVLVEKDAKVKLNVSYGEKIVYQNVLIAPSAKIPLDTEPQEAPKRGKAYSKNAFYPEKPFQVETTEVRGMTLAHVEIAPFQYNPITKELIVYKDLQVELSSRGGKGIYVEDRFRSRYWDPIFSDMIINYGDLAKSPIQRIAKDEVQGCEYLIVVPDIDVNQLWADSIRIFRNEQGISTKIISIKEIGGNNIETLNTFFEEVYQNWNPVPSAVLLMADYDEGDKGITSQEYDHPNEGTYITDNYFADVTGNNLPDFVFARMAGSKNSHFKVMVNKMRSYEVAPPMDADFYNKPITALGWQTERWFQICSEVVGGYFKNVQGKEPTRINEIYEGDPVLDGVWSSAFKTQSIVNFFGPSGLNYIPETPAELGDWSDGSAQDVIDAINAGSFMLQHRDHGYEGGWGEPAFRKNHISSLTNADKLIHIFSINCLTGRFNYGSESFAEKFHRHPGGGALSITAASQVSYSFVNDVFVWGMFDNMFSDFLPEQGVEEIESRDFRPAFGIASGKYFLSESNWVTSAALKRITYQLFHHHGDAFGVVYSEVPQELTVSIPEQISREATSISVTANEGAVIGISVDGEILATAVGTGAEQIIAIPAQEPGSMVKTVVTMQNYLRYEGTSLVFADGIAWVNYINHQIKDSDDENETIENMESVFIDLGLRNFGDQLSGEITADIICNSEYVEIIDAEENYATFEAFQTKEEEKVFELKIKDGIPDQTVVPVTIQIHTDGELITKEISFIVFAPKPELDTYDVAEVDAEGDGFLDANEEVMIDVKLKNNGSRVCNAGTLTLSNVENKVTFTENTFSVEEIAAAGFKIISAKLNLDASVVSGELIDIPMKYESGAYIVEEVLTLGIGKFVDDFETGTTSLYAWEPYGTKLWTIDETEKFEGKYSTKSALISDSEKTALTLDMDVFANSQISFYIKTSTENNFDVVRFFIDDVRQGYWSGETDWTKCTYPIEKGVHNIKWEYSKDNADGAGQDFVWVDQVSLPIGNIVQLYPGANGEICEDSPSFTTQPTISNIESVTWKTSGDGSFSDPSSFETTYTAGEEDLKSENVILSLTAEKGEKSYSYDMTLKVDDCTGVFEINNTASMVFPNPANASIELDLSNDENLSSIQIVDIQGRVVYFQNWNKKSQNKIDVSTIEDGVYLIHMNGEKKSYIQKLVIKH